MDPILPHEFYWARSDKYDHGRITVVEVSTVFGESQENWTLAVPGSDQHFIIEDFEILNLIERPLRILHLQATE